MSKKYIKYKVLILALFSLMLCMTQVNRAETLSPTEVKDIIREIDQLYRSDNSYSELEMEIVTPHWQRTLEMVAWTRGMDKTFIRIISPKKEKEIATLRIKNEMWNYLPKINKVIKIPPSMMMSSWMGSDFTNDDLVKEFTLFEDYTYKLIQVENGGEDLLHIDCIPRQDLPVVWSHIVIAVREKDHMPVWQRYYDEKDKLMRVLNYSGIKRFDDRTIPSVMELIPQNKEGHKTIIRYLKLQFNLKVEEEVFSLRNLRASQ
jgi:outer membrane lipoprotein-sorting protein